MKKWLIPVLSVLIIGCNPKVVSYQNPKASYSTFETYRVVSPKIDNNQIDKETVTIFNTIRGTIEGQMSKRGYSLSSISPDLTLRYELTSGTRVQTSTQQSPFFRAPMVNSQTIIESFLLLELYNQKQKLVWQGSYDLKQERKERKATIVVENAIARIFTTYPYKALESQPDPSLTIYEKKKKKK